MLKLFDSKKYIILLYKKYWWLTPVTIFLVWRIFLEIIGQYFYNLDLAKYSNTIWWRWDSDWYGSIVQHGYGLRAGLQSNVTFFPLYPLLWKIVALVTKWPNHISALIASNLLALGSFVIFYRWLSVVWGEVVAKRGLLALAVFPTSFFLISVYSESTLLFLVVLMFLFVERGKWRLAAFMSLFASATRPVGIFLWPVLFCLWFFKIKNTKIINKVDFWSIIILPPIGILLFSLYLWVEFGDALAWLHGQGNYGRNLVFPHRLLYAYVVNIILRGEYWVRHLIEMVALLLIVVCLPKLKKIDPVYVLFAVLNLLPSLFSNTLTSIQRFVLIIAPIFIVIAKQKNFIYILYLVLSFLLLVFGMVQFVNLKWAG